MGTAARKARKRAGVPFQHSAKEPTPLFWRSISTSRLAREIEARGLGDVFLALQDQLGTEGPK